MGTVSQIKVLQDDSTLGFLSLPLNNRPRGGHRSQPRDLKDSSDNNKFSIDRQALANLLNYVHFVDGTITLVFKSRDLSNDSVLRARPQACHDDFLICCLLEDPVSNFDPSRYQFDKLVVEHGTFMILVPAAFVGVERNSITLRLPNSSQVLQRRKSRRYRAQGVSVDIIQYSFGAPGTLLDFCCDAFRIEVKTKDSQLSSGFDQEAPVFTMLHRDNRVFFTGVCRCVRHEDTTDGRQLVLISEEDKIFRFKRSRIRNPRIRLELTPRISFVHPFFRKKIQLDVADISTSGFSVSESPNESVLMPGLIIPDLTINYAGGVNLRCSAQVIYRSEDDAGLVRSGISIMDIGLEDYSRLAHILTNAMDPHLHVSGDIDLESLWEFFFSSGFIYPKKYAVFQSEKEECKDTCRLLYQKGREIAKHFTYEKNGHIYGHISMVRAYDQTWVIHHHASQSANGRRNGFGVLKALMVFLNDMRRFPSAKMKYAMCYYRPENRFPAAVFGDFAAAAANRSVCSVDRFSYHPHAIDPVSAQIPSEWLIQECDERDLSAIIDWYKDRSRGLMFDAMGLCQKSRSGESIEMLYDRVGLFRRTKVFSLKKRDQLVAGFVVNQADPGLNLSQLFSSVTLLVMDEPCFPWLQLGGFLFFLTGHHNTYDVPVLIYPPDSAKGKIPSTGKHYEMWVLNAQHGEEYLDFIEKRFKLGFSKYVLLPGIA